MAESRIYWRGKKIWWTWYYNDTSRWTSTFTSNGNGNELQVSRFLNNWVRSTCFRHTCKNLYKDIPYEDLPEVVKYFGGYEDKIIDNFGLPLPVCSMKEGFIPNAAKRALTILSNGYKQRTWVPSFHKTGFEIMKIPKDIFTRIKLVKS